MYLVSFDNIMFLVNRLSSRKAFARLSGRISVPRRLVDVSGRKGRRFSEGFL